MGLFEKPQNTEQKEDLYEGKLRDLNAQKIRLTRQIGERFIEENLGHDMSNTVYQDLFLQLDNTEKDIELTMKQQLASRGLRKCESCGAELPINSAFCNKCGAKQGDLEKEVVTAGKICPKCGATLEKNDLFCISCGYKL